uniref:Uncharacterized protein n=1 Tax=Physcomitrium patens TaxID=3218 RepID=A0A2K1KPY0_PHYPA|nr:hypothetical protein PHYPA_006698 [Physcomitrium patens]
MQIGRRLRNGRPATFTTKGRSALWRQRLCFDVRLQCPLSVGRMRGEPKIHRMILGQEGIQLGFDGIRVWRGLG